MIGVLTGIIQLDSGTAHICGMNVDTHMDLLRKRLGICPQFDILWDDLTAEEHLRMFGQLKRIQNLE
jgi:ABC-type multidrug transport system ATPase subunit